MFVRCTGVEAMAGLYPAIEPYEQGMLDVGDGQRLYWEQCGNPTGKAAVVLHGGPGSGCTAGMRRFFDPAAYRVVLFDQRNAGRSTPHASEAATDLSANTTQHLIADIERLREHLGIEAWLVFGTSWGCTLGLAYAERHPERVSALVALAVTMTRPADIDWLYHGLGQFFPEEWMRFRAGVPEGERDANLVEAYHLLLEGADVAVREQAARDWCEWEEAVVSLHAEQRKNPRYERAEFRMAFARIVTHYFSHNAWLEDGQLLRDAGRLAGIPAVLVHGRMDLTGPLMTAWELARAWPGAELVVVDDAGHDGRDPGMGERVVEALERLKG
jgi:proline iminopeptidase